jgi:hypothetical protein
MAPATPHHRSPSDPCARARGEGGAMLLVALVLCASLALLSLALLASHDGAVRARANASLSRQAESAAAAGVEWAAARDVDRGRIAGTTTLGLGGGRSVTVTIASTAPHVVSQGSCSGARVTLTANLTAVGGGPLPHAFASMHGTSKFDHRLVVVGAAYFGDTVPLDASGNQALEMNGDLHLVRSTAPPAGTVLQVSGSTLLGVRTINDPVVDTSPYESMTSGAVPVLRYSGNTMLANTTLDGVVVVQLGSGQTLTLQDVAVRGAVVVTASAGLLGGGGLLGLGLIRPKVRLRGATTIDGGTARTGNLALLAAFCDLDGNSSSATINGVSLAYRGDRMDRVTFRGQLVLMQEVIDTDNAWRVERAPGFVPDTPIGITWPCQASTRITWLGRQ